MVTFLFQNSAAADSGIVEVLKTLINEFQHTRYKEQVRSEWMQLSMVIDRTMGLLILLFAIIITAAITMHAKTW